MFSKLATLAATHRRATIGLYILLALCGLVLAATKLEIDTNPGRMIEISTALNKHALTIGFARRFATYKRAHLLFRDLDRLAKIAGISVPHLNRRFRQLLRLSPMEYVTSLRIQEAQRLLTATDDAIGEIAIATGFYDQSHLNRTLKEASGFTPDEFRRFVS